MSDEDFSALLGDEAGEIQPVKVDRRVPLKKQNDRDVSLGQRKQNAQEFSAADTTAEDPLDTAAMDKVEPMDLLQFQRPGVQHGVYKNLRLGKYSIDAVLDLHRMSVEQARLALFRFIQDCLENEIRTALITHGKGEGRETPALLKSCVAHWLPQMEEVLAFHTAQKQHGSYGATYVLLRKSEATKLRNKQKHNR